MAARELVFDILAIDRASKTLAKIGGEAEALGGKFGVAGKAISKGLDVAAAVVVGVGIASVKTAADMETAMTRLTTTAGESSKNIQMVWSGIDKMAGQVGYSVKELASAMYFVESGGYHGAKGLDVLRVAAQGAKIENADVTDVAHALAGAMNDYRKQNIDAATAMNVMTAAVGHGMMTFQDMAEALPKVGARAAATGIKFQELMAAMATMTQDGLPATVAATYLGQTIGQLAAPTAKAQKEMENLGISAIGVSKAITSGSGHGLGDAIQMLFDGITKHLNPAGLVAIENFKKASDSTAAWQKMLVNMPPELQTVVQALALSSGGVKAFQGLLMLGGANIHAYNSNLGAMNAQLAKGKGAVAGVAEQQATLNGKLADAKGAWSALLDQWGQQLLPMATHLAGKLQDLTTWIGHHGPVVKDLAVTVGILTAAVKLATATQWLWNIALDANPIGIIIIGVGLLAAGIYVLHEHMELLGPAFVWLGHAWDNMRIAGLRALQWLQDGLLRFVDVFVHGADVAFGWIPLLGPKIHGVAMAFEKFKNDANASLEGMIHDIKVNADFRPIIAGYDHLAATIGKPITIPVAIAGMASGAHSAASANNLVGLLYPKGSSGPAARINVNVGGGANSVRNKEGGGHMQAGMPYRVGETGSEIIVPGVDSYAMTSRASKAGSKGALVNIENYHEGSKSVQQIAAELMFRARFA